MNTTASSEPALRIVLAAGGTGGHIMPALATAEALAQRAYCDFLVVGSPRAGERAIRGLVPYPVVEVRARSLAGSGLIGKLLSAAALPFSILSAVRHLRRFRADLVIATGGYVCGPTGIAAWLARVPLLVLEQNAAPGITTRGLRAFARAIAVSFPETATRLGRKAVVTGNPIRAALPMALTRDEPTPCPSSARAVRLLILGGSQGARGLNSMIELAIPFLAAADIGLKIVHQTGIHDIERLRATYAEHGIPATVTPFINNIGDAYARTDLVCARAGATTVAELSYCGLPAILVPFPSAAGKHQHDNAAALARVGAAAVIEEQSNGTAIAEAIIDLAANRSKLAAMATASAACGRDDAAAAVAELALGLLAGVRPAPSTGTRYPTNQKRTDRSNAPRTTETC